MAKKANKNNLTKVLIGVIVVLVVIFAIYIISNNNSNNSSSETKLSDSDFKITHLSWDTSFTSQFGIETINWTASCKAGHQTYQSISYTLTTEQVPNNLVCDYLVNGQSSWTDPSGNVEELKNYNFNKNDGNHGGFANLDYRKDNNITICCRASMWDTNQLCKSAILYSTCSQ